MRQMQLLLKPEVNQEEILQKKGIYKDYRKKKFGDIEKLIEDLKSNDFINEYFEKDEVLNVKPAIFANNLEVSNGKKKIFIEYKVLKSNIVKVGLVA